jgi:hypothetical protein
MRISHSFSLIVIGGLLGAGAACTKKTVTAPDPAFEQSWAKLAAQGMEVAYIEDDRGEGLMGNVRRASRVKADPPAIPAEQPVAEGAMPEQVTGQDVQRIVRGNLMAVRSCYMTMAKTGQARSGKAIVSFSIGADGKPATIRVDAPSFQDTPLPKCMTAQINRWQFPKSQRGGGTVSYPFVFVGS